MLLFNSQCEGGIHFNYTLGFNFSAETSKTSVSLFIPGEMRITVHKGSICKSNKSKVCFCGCAYFIKIKRWSRLKGKTVAREQSNHRVNCAAPRGAPSWNSPSIPYLFIEMIITPKANEWNTLCRFVLLQQKLRRI